MVNSLLDWFKVRNYEENIHLVLKFNLDGVGHNIWSGIILSGNEVCGCGVEQQYSENCEDYGPSYQVCGI